MLKKPLVLNGGQIEQLQSGDTLDATVAEIEVLTQTNGESGAIVIGTPVYSSAVDTVKKAEANASGTVEVLGLVKSVSIANGTTGSIQTTGVLVATTAQWDAVAGTTGGLTFNTVYFLDPATAGKITATAPTTGGQYVVRIGKAISSTELVIQPGEPILL
jgi:hypothetical protein